MAKAKELDGVACRGVFELVAKDEIPNDKSILGSRFVLIIKNKDTDKDI